MIWATPQSRLNETLARSDARRVILLSSDGGMAVPASFAPLDLLHLQFNDIVEQRPGLVAPDRSHVRAMIDFCGAAPADAPLIVACYAGISRSTAAAYLLACWRAPSVDEGVLAVRLRAAAPSATPNRLLITLADDMLARDGRMIRAIRGIGRGRDAFEGDPFCLSGGLK